MTTPMQIQPVDLTFDCTDNEIRIFSNSTSYCSIEKLDETFLVNTGVSIPRSTFDEIFKKVSFVQYCIFTILYISAFNILVSKMLNLIPIMAPMITPIIAIGTLTLMIPSFFVIWYILFCKIFASHKLKSKITAMNKLLNFVKNYHALPKTIEEVMSESRFYSLNQCKESARYVFWLMLSIFLNCSISLIIALVLMPVLNFSSFEALHSMLFMLSILFTSVWFYKTDNKNIIECKPIENFISMLLQYGVTTSKIDEEDIFMAKQVINNCCKNKYPQDVYLF